MLKLKILLLCSVALGLTFSPAVRADRYVVAPGTPGANPESPYDTWAKAATNIQVAVDAATPGETIWVSNGTYKATGAGTTFFYGTSMVHIATNVTLRSVNGPDVTILDGGYPGITNRVISLDRNAALSGFTIVNGCASRGGGIIIGYYGGMVSNCFVCNNISDSALNAVGDKYPGGAGIATYLATGYTGYVYNSSIYNNTAISNSGGGGRLSGPGVVRNCEFYENDSLYTVLGGGGCYIRDSITVSQCVFSNNTAPAGYGGGVYSYLGATVLDGCCIVNNSSKHGGGGYFAYYGNVDALITNCVISDNTSDIGAGVHLRSSVENFKIANCNISSNQSTRYGGGLEFRNGKVILTDCLIANNSAAEYGGGFSYYSTNIYVSEFINCVIRDNTAANQAGGAGANLAGPSRMIGCLVTSNVITHLIGGSIGAGIRITSDGVICENNTVVGNKTETGTGGGIHMSSAGQVNNTIIYGNTSRAGENQDWATTGVGTFFNCCAADITGMTGSGNIAADPEFVDAAAGDYHLPAASPCVNAGLNQDWMADGVDLDGRPRLDRFVKQVDIGCYEHHFQGAMFFIK